MKKIIAGLLLTLTVVAFGQKKHTVALNLEKGKTYNQGIDATVEMTQMVAGQEIPITIAMNGKLSYTVAEIANNAYTLDSKYIDLGMKMNAGGMNMEFSTTIEPTDTLSRIMYKMMKAITQGTFKVIMSKQGRVLEVTGIESLLDGMMAQFPTLPDAQKEQLKQQMAQSFGDKSLRGSIEMATAIFPDKPVAIGETWSVEVLNNGSMPVKMNTQFVLSEVTSTHYLLKGNAKVETDKTATSQSNGFDMTFDLKGTATSELKISKTSGWIAEGVTKQNLSGSAIASGGQLPSPMTIGMTMDSTTKISGN